MVNILSNHYNKNNNYKNSFSLESRMSRCDTLLRYPANKNNLNLLELKASLFLQTGHEEQSVKMYEDIFKKSDVMSTNSLLPHLGISYMNPGQNNNNWISLKLDGVKANKAAIGSKIKVTFTENGNKRSVYKVVNSGGSFGSSPLRQEIGIGKVALIDELQITWAGSQLIQHFNNIKPNQFLRITEGERNTQVIRLKKLTFKAKPQAPMCMPMPGSIQTAQQISTK